ncbi:hypothetical protein CUMW_004130 [Citrus unshiu]|nr:hypothetical protein CUMW_004130 [Citrus unshiu]
MLTLNFPQSEQRHLSASYDSVKDACKTKRAQKKPRTLLNLYFCELSTPIDSLSKMYGVVSRRRARVLKEGMHEGSALFTVHAYLPVSESFGFADELRKETSGAASALLALSQFEAVFCDILTGDPFCVK